MTDHCLEWRVADVPEREYLKPGVIVRIHDIMRPHQPVVGSFLGRSENRHWLVDVGGKTHLIASEVVTFIEIGNEY